MSLVKKPVSQYLLTLLLFIAGNFSVLFAQQLPEDIDENTHVAMVGELIFFRNLSQGSYGFEWDFGDNSPFETQAEPTHAYSLPGRYEVLLTVSTPRCTEVVSKTVIIYDEEALYSTLYPNPAEEYSTLFFVNEYFGEVAITVTDIAGKVLEKTLVTKEHKTFLYELNVAEYATGTYLVRLEMGRQSSAHKLLKK